MLLTLRVCLVVLGVSAIVIALSIFVLGAQATADMAENLFDALFRSSAPLSGPWPPTMDSELRFYAALWGAYGFVLMAVASDLTNRGHLVPWLAAVFFAGGLGRVVSYLSLGPPHPFFMLLMAVELLLPPVILCLWLAAGRGNRPAAEVRSN
jgi:hypothetical protein